MSSLAPGGVARDEIMVAVLDQYGHVTDVGAFVGRIYAYAARAARLGFVAHVLPDGRVHLAVARPDGVVRADIQEVASATREAAVIWRRLMDEVLGQPDATGGPAA